MTQYLIQELNFRARGADFQVAGGGGGGRLMRTRLREPTRGSGGILPQENLKLVF